jgi:hypothetical protein
MSIYYFKSFFSLKHRTKIYFLYSKLSKILQEIISNTPDCDLFKGCCVSYKDVNFESAKILEDDINPHDVFEFKKDQNVPYQITVEFRSFLTLLLSCLLGPSHPWFFALTNQEEYSKTLYKEVKTERLMDYPVKEIMGYPTGNRTVDMVKKYTIVILDFYKPLFEQYSISEEDQEEKTLQAEQTYKTSFKCNEEEKEQQSIWGRIVGTFTQQPTPQPMPRYIYFKNKKISKHKASPNKIKKSHSKHKSSPKKIKKSHSKHKASPNKIKKSQSKQNKKVPIQT